jgi:integrase
MPVKDGIAKRGNTWSFVIRVKDPATGQSKPKWVGGFPTEDAAKAARDEARVASRRGEYVHRSGITVAAYLAEWLDGHALEVKPRTLAGYREMVDRYVVPRIGKMRVQSVTPATLTRLYLDLLEGGGKDGRALSRRTVDYVHATLRKAFNDAVRVEGLLPSNPAERAKRPKVVPAKKHGEVWDAQQLRLFLSLVAGHRWHALYRLAAYTGARRGELLALRWVDVDWAAGTIRIRASAGMFDGERIEGTTKIGLERTDTIDPETLRILRAHKRDQDAERLVAGEAWEETGLVFANGLGRPIYPTAPYARMVRVIQEYGTAREKLPEDQRGLPLPHARFHDLRHVHATLLLRDRVPVHVVAKRLGHADPSVTLRVYAHVIPDQEAEVALRFAALVDGPADQQKASDPAA